MNKKSTAKKDVATKEPGKAEVKPFTKPQAKADQPAAELSPIQLQAITRAVTEKTKNATRDLIKPGEYNGKFTATFEYIMKVGEDGEQTPTSHTLSVPAAIKGMLMAGAQKENIINFLLDLATTAVKTGESSADLVREKYPEVVEVEKAFKEELAKLPKIQKRGTVDANVQIVEVHS